MIDVLRQLPLKSRFGFVGISSHLIHNIELYSLKSLALLAKQPLNSGIFFQINEQLPKLFQYLKSDSTKLIDYRPITILSVISKVRAKVTYKQLYCFVLKNMTCFVKVSTVFAQNSQLNWQQLN